MKSRQERAARDKFHVDPWMMVDWDLAALFIEESEDESLRKSELLVKSLFEIAFEK